MMKENSIIKKPFALILALVVIAAAIFFLQSQKVSIPDDVNLEQNKGDGNVNLDTGSGGADTDNSETTTKNTFVTPPEIEKEKSKYTLAPDFYGIENWINSEPLKMEELRGKVVLIDFWTYTCINCIRTLPYIKEWDAKYRDEGLVIVGVHTPEFEFEKKYDNVVKAAADYGLKYPIAQDNLYATWRAYKNRYWPHKFLIDVDGRIRYDHIGEGGYDKTEKVIQELLAERAERLDMEKKEFEISKPEGAVEVDRGSVGTPEIYFGYDFERGDFGSPEGIKPNQVVNYSIPGSIMPNKVYLLGEWKNNKDNMEFVGEEGSVVLVYQAKVLNIVAGSEEESQVVVYVDDKELDGKNKGRDITLTEDGSISNVGEFKLYNLVDAKEYATHAISINVKDRGFKIYSFTFG